MCDDCEDMMLEAGKKFERERIIALLEAKVGHDKLIHEAKNQWMPCQACRLIALIKGENK